MRDMTRKNVLNSGQWTFNNDFYDGVKKQFLKIDPETITDMEKKTRIIKRQNETRQEGEVTDARILSLRLIALQKGE